MSQQTYHFWYKERLIGKLSMLAMLETDTSSWGTHSAGQDQTHQVTAHLSALALPAPPCPRRGGEAGCQRSLHGPGGSVTGGAWL